MWLNSPTLYQQHSDKYLGRQCLINYNFYLLCGPGQEYYQRPSAASLSGLDALMKIVPIGHCVLGALLSASLPSPVNFA